MHRQTLRYIPYWGQLMHNRAIVTLICVALASVVSFVYIQIVVDEMINEALAKLRNPSESLSGIESDVDSLLASRAIARYVILCMVLCVISIIVLFLSKTNSLLKRTVEARTRELNFANKQLIQMNDLLKANYLHQKEFINAAAHELRTPLQPLLGISELLEGQLSRIENVTINDLKSEINMIIRNTRRLESLSSELLWVTKIDNVGLSLNMESVDLSQIVNEAIEDVRKRPDVLSSNTRIFFEKLEKHIFFEADRERILQALTSLLINATKFGKVGSIEIVVTLNKDNTVLVNVIDDGKGIPADLMLHLFEKFASGSERGESTGLGLYITRRIIEAHGGQIWARNNASGKGATFSFQVPVAHTNGAINRDFDGLTLKNDLP